MPIRKLLQVEPPRRHASTQALVGGVGLALAVLGAFVALALFEREQGRLRDLARLEVVARSLEEQGTRNIESAFVVLSSVADEAVHRSGLGTQPVASETLRRLIGGFSSIRSVALVDARGRVVASSDPGDIGIFVSLARLGLDDTAIQERIGTLIAGRVLRDVASGSQSRTPPGLSFLPLGRFAALPDGSPGTAVALLNTDALSSQIERSLGSSTEAAAYASYDGVVWAASRSSELTPGQRVDAMPVFERYLPTDEHEQYVGVGVRGPDQIVAFRASHARPIVAIVEDSGAANTARWLRQMRWIGALTAGVVLVVLAMAWMASRSLRAREEARQRLDKALLKVALRERELTVIVESVQALIFRADEEGRLTFVNARACALFGRAPEDLVGRRLVDLVDTVYQGEVASLFDVNAPRTGRFAVSAGQGGRRHFEIAVVPLHDDGSTDGFACSAIDVTERVRATRQIKSQLAYSDLLFEISPLPMWLVDSEERIVNVNHAWEAFHGVARRVAIGQAPSILTSQSSVDEAMHDTQAKARVALRKVEGRLRYETRMRAADGSMRDVVVTEVEVPSDDGAAGGVLSVMMDVSEFRDAERATREARDVAEEASRAKSEFVANISHELRTPLQSILGFSELGSDRAKDHPRATAMFDDIHAAGERMLALVNDLLDVSKIESSVGTFHLERGDVREAVRSVARELEPLLAAKSIDLNLALGAHPLNAKVDPLRFQQVVRNVLANAIKFSPANGQIDVSATLLSSAEIRISVRDRGPGIPPAELERIFEAFAQSSITRDGSGGTGLGLAISRTIMQAFGGHISAENAAQGGSVFHLILPARGFADTMPMGSINGGDE